MTPGQAEYAEAELRRAAETLDEARLLLDAAARSGAASRLYYAVFHAARAALTVRGRYSKTHAGLIKMFGQTFGPAPILQDLAEKRAEADYSMEEFDVSRDELAAKAEEAKVFLERCREIVSGAIAAGPDEPDPPPDL